MNKRVKLNQIAIGVVFLIDICVYVLAGLISHTIVYPIAALLLAALALFHYMRVVDETGSWINLTGIFFLSWIGGQVLAMLRLSFLQREWSWQMWLLLCVSVIFFALGSETAKRIKLFKGRGTDRKRAEMLPAAESLGRATVLLAGLSILCLLIEFAVLKYLPIFSPKPHAYSYFHLKGLHYITVSAMYVPSLAVLYQLRKKKEHSEKSRLDRMVLVSACAALLVPIVCVSRYQLFMAVFLALICYLLAGNHLTKKMLICLFIAAIIGYAVLTILRRHDIEYLNSIFEPRWKHMPIFITQPYMYIANNYENLNYLTEKVPPYAFGARSLAPLWSLTGLVKMFPSLGEFPTYCVKEELITLTCFYDSYYDFGIPGVCLLAVFMGWCGEKTQRFTWNSQNPVAYFLFAQVMFYYMMAFFTTWTSNLAVWFGLFITLVLYVYVERGMRHVGKDSGSGDTGL